MSGAGSSNYSLRADRLSEGEYHEISERIAVHGYARMGEK